MIESLPEGRLQMGARVLGAARLSEKPRILWFALLTLMRGVPGLAAWLPDELWIRLHGLWFRVAVAQAEMEGFLQAWILGIYDSDADLIGRPGDVVVDGGASVGFYAMRQAAAGARVLAFEPNPPVFRRLRAGVLRNGLDHLVHLVPAALGERTEERPFFVQGSNTLAGSLFRDLEDLPRDLQGVTPVVTMDETARDLGFERVDLIKLDVEGAECLALQGASRSLAGARGLVVEYHSEALRDCCARQLSAAGLRVVSDDGRHLLCKSEFDRFTR